MVAISPNITRITAIDDTAIVSAADMASYINLGPSAAIAQAGLLDELIQTATDVLSKYLWLSLQRTTYEAYYSLDYNCFCSVLDGDLRLTLERAPIVSLDDITKIEYLDDNNNWTEFDKGTESITGLFDNVTEKHEQRQWASIYFDTPVQFQDRFNAYKIRVTFISGFICNDPVYKVPSPIITAIKKIVAYHYIHRGDCAGSTCEINGYPVPCDVKGLLFGYDIKKTILGGLYNSC